MSDDIHDNLFQLLKTQLPLLTIISSLEIIAGLLLENMSNYLISQPAILLLVPAFLALGGNIGITYGSRLSTAIHLGILKFNIKNTIFKNNIIAISVASIITFLFMGLFSSIINNFGTISVNQVIFISLLAGTVLVAIIMPTAVLIAYISYKRGIDPDYTMIPSITAIADIIGMFVLFIILKELSMI
jgi:mgtE-like transporter